MPNLNSTIQVVISAGTSILKNSTLQFLAIVGILFISGFFLTLLSKWTSNSFRQFRFPNFGLYIFGVIGIPLHEFCHALFAKLFFHQIKSIKWFDPSGKGGSYGTVIHYYNEKNLYHRIGLFFIGMGPVLLAPFILYAAYYFLVPNSFQITYFQNQPLSVLQTFAKSIFIGSNWTSLPFYFFLYFAVCLTSQMELSDDDFKIARGGILPFFFILIVLNTIAFLFNFNLQGQLMQALNWGIALWGSFFLVAIFVAICNLVLCCFVLNAINRLSGHETINPFKS